MRNEAVEKVQKRVAKAAAAETDGLTISPLINTDRKGGAYRIMHQQFRRAIGCAIVRGQAKLTLGRLYYALCEGDKGRSGKREQITSQQQQMGTKPTGKIIMVQQPYSGGIYNF